MAEARIIREATREDISYVAANLREEDKAELRAMHGPKADFDTIIYVASLQSDTCYAWCDADNKPCAVFGISPMPYYDRVGVPWLLGTEALKLHAIQYLKDARRIMREALDTKYGYLQNCVHDDNKSSIKFLAAAGFSIGPPDIESKYRGVFRRFDMGDREGCLTNAFSDTLLTSEEI